MCSRVCQKQLKPQTIARIVNAVPRRTLLKGHNEFRYCGSQLPEKFQGSFEVFSMINVQIKGNTFI